MITTKNIALFTLTKDRIDYTKRMLKSLAEFTHIPYDHYVIDNGSTDGTVEFLNSKPAGVVQVVFNHENRGLSVGWNQALDLIGTNYDYIIKIDNDCEILSNNWLQPTIEAIGALDDRIILSPYVEGLRENKGGAPRHAWKTVNSYEIGFTKHLGGISLISPAAAYENFRFNEKLPLRGGQDTTFSAHVDRIGYLMGYIESIKVRHIDTTDGQQIKYPDYFVSSTLENQRVYAEKPIISTLMRPYRRWRLRKSTKAIRKLGHQ